MKTALITTTINVPTVLKLYQKLDDTVAIFVAGDKKTDVGAQYFLEKMATGLEECRGATGVFYLAPDQQTQWSCSELLGWNNDSRRNIALLEALKWGAEIIVSIDDDMIPCQGEFVWPGLFEYGYDGLQFGEPGYWFDAGQFTIPIAKQRGLPLDYGFMLPVDHVIDAKIGAAQGIILGVPDTDACTAVTSAPRIHSVSDILRNGFVVHPQAYAVFNSQITAFRRELAPAFAQFYNHQGRNTDIFASLLMRRIMQERELYTYYGPPMAFHARAPRPLFNDLKAEMFGLEHIADFADYLRRSPLLDAPVVDQCRLLTEGCNLFSDEAKECAMAWYSDVERALG